MARRWRVLMIGDVVGEPGLRALEARLPGLIRGRAADCVVVNGENAAGGFGLSRETLSRILAAGADVVTTGNHVWEKREFWPVLESERRVLRPANYPPGSPGRGFVRVEKPGCPAFLVVNLQGRELMPPIDCPFRTFDAVSREGAGEDALVLVDFHAESSREKEALGFYLDGRAAAAAGTHTHVQTADERVLPGGTAYITDLGMTGVTTGVIGMDPKLCLDRARTQVLFRMEVAGGSWESGEATVQGIVVELDAASRKALSVERIG